MPVLITAVVPGQTQEGHDATMAILRPLLEQAKGFIAHGAGMSAEGWRVFEIWDRRTNMPYGIVHHFPGGTKEQYEASITAVHPSRNRLPSGQIFHAAGPSAGGWTIVAVHESRDSSERFRNQILMPRMGRVSQVVSRRRLRRRRSRSTTFKDLGTTRR